MHTLKISPIAYSFLRRFVSFTGHAFPIAPILTILVLASCTKSARSSSGPSVNEAEAALRQEVESVSKNQMKLVSFTKTDGQSIEFSGVTGYRMTFKAQVQFESDGTWKSQDPIDQQTIVFAFAPGHAGSGTMNDFENTLVGGRRVRRGEQASITGVMKGEKSESGWKFKRGESQFESGR